VTEGLRHLAATLYGFVRRAFKKGPRMRAELVGAGNASDCEMYST